MLRLTSMVSILFVSLCLVACGSGGSSMGGGGSTPPVGAPQLSISPASLTFGSTVVGTTSAAQAVTLTNSGSASLSFTSITLADTSNFSLTNNCGSSLAVGGSCTLSVAFQPQSAATPSSSISINDNVLGSPQSIAITGSGAAAAAPTLTVSPSSVVFGSAAIGATPLTQNITLANTGSATLTFTNGISISDTTDFQLMNSCGTQIDPRSNTNCTLAVSFQPQTTGPFSATINIANNAAGAPQSISVTGTGTAALVPAVTLSTNAITFPSTTIGATSPAQSVTVTNSGTGPLTGITISLTGTDTARFSQTSNCPTTLGAGASCTINATFTPADAKTYSAAISIADNATGAPQSVGLSGSGAAVMSAEAVLSPLSLTFPDTLSGNSSATQTVTLSNPGSATLTGIAVSIGGGTASTAFTDTTNCGATLTAGQSCSIYVTFSPSSTGNYLGTLTVTDTASSSPQTASLSGNGIAPQAMLSSNAITFPSTTVNTTTSAYSVTLSNPGSATLNISGITLGGTNASNFAETTTCGATLAVNASCTISATFSPTAATSYSGTITVTTNAGGAQSISLTGTGSTAAVTRTLYTFPESDNSVTPLYALVNNAQKTIDMTMYELVDTTFSADLVAACKRGVIVRVILDQNLEKSSNTAAYNQLNGTTNCSAVWANTAFQATHQKTITVDGTQTAIMSLNLTSRYYSDTRDYALVENDAADIAAIEATFNADYAAGTPSSGTAGASDFSYSPGAGDDLIWSPTTAQPDLVGIINAAQKTLLVENEEMSASSIVTALENACKRGVAVNIAMTDTGSYHANYSALEAAGCGVHTGKDNSSTLYIHGKALLADYGLSTQSVYMGSINFSNASMTENRELGLYISDPTAVQKLYNAMSGDYAMFPAY